MTRPNTIVSVRRPSNPDIVATRLEEAGLRNIKVRAVIGIITGNIDADKRDSLLNIKGVSSVSANVEREINEHNRESNQDDVGDVV